jgi:hypothetical protein
LVDVDADVIGCVICRSCTAARTTFVHARQAPELRPGPSAPPEALSRGSRSPARSRPWPPARTEALPSNLRSSSSEALREAFPAASEATKRALRGPAIRFTGVSVTTGDQLAKPRTERYWWRRVRLGFSLDPLPTATSFGLKLGFEPLPPSRLRPRDPSPRLAGGLTAGVVAASAGAPASTSGKWSSRTIAADRSITTNRLAIKSGRIGTAGFHRAWRVSTHGACPPAIHLPTRMAHGQRATTPAAHGRRRTSSRPAR